MAVKYSYAAVPPDAFDKLAVGSGVLLAGFDPAARTCGAQLGATSGGISIRVAPAFADMGAGIDNCPKNAMELVNVTGLECKISGSFVTIDGDMLARLIGAADADGGKITPRTRLSAGDFADLWYVCDYGAGGFVAARLKNALSTGGFSLRSADRDKARFEFEFTGHASLAEPDAPAVEFYVEPSAMEESADENAG